MSSRNLTVRHVLPDFGRVPTDLNLDSLSGIVRVAVTMALRQVALYERVELFGLNRDHSAMNYKLEGVHVSTTPGMSIGKTSRVDWRYFLPLILRAITRRVNIMHVHDNPFLLSLPGAGKRILHLHTPIHTRLTSAFPIAAMRSDVVICNSNSIRDDFLRCVPFNAAQVHVVHNGVDIERFHGSTGDPRSRLGIPKSELAILFVGQLSPEKGLHHLIEAISRLSNRYTIHLLVAGSSTVWQAVDSPKDEGPSAYETRLRELGRGLPIHFMGKVASGDIPAVYQAADIFVCPSEWPEPFGIVNIEGMAAGKPVVASRTGGIPEIVLDGETGILVQPGNVIELANGIECLINDPTLRERLGAAGRARVQSHFTWATAMAKVERIYDSPR